MGSSSSKNVIQNTTEILTQSITNHSQSISNTSQSSQIISYEAGTVNGDINIKGNTFNSTAKLNLQALLDSNTTNNVQQDVYQKLEQLAKSESKGIALGLIADADNEIKNYLKATVNIENNVNQTCSQSINISQAIDIKVDTQNGNVNIEGNSFDVATSGITNVVANMVSSNTVLQKIQQQMSQSATATVAGIDPFMIIIAIIVAVCVIGSGTLYAMTSKTVACMISMLIFFCVMGIGGGMINLYLQHRNDKDIILYPFTPPLLTETAETQRVCLVNNPGSEVNCYNPCGVTLYKTLNNVSSYQVVAEQCKQDENCQAFDWQIDGTAHLYSSIIDNCDKLKQNSDQKLLRMTKVFCGNGDPNKQDTQDTANDCDGDVNSAFDNDVYINYTNAQWFKFNASKNEWVNQGEIVKDVKSCQVGKFENEPTDKYNKENVVVSTSNGAVWKYEKGNWQQISDRKILKFLLPVPSVDFNRIENYAGVVTKVSKYPNYLPMGVGVAGIGFLGFIVSFGMLLSGGGKKQQPAK